MLEGWVAHIHLWFGEIVVPVVAWEYLVMLQTGHVSEQPLADCLLDLGTEKGYTFVRES
jgi:hypothetical protein